MGKRYLVTGGAGFIGGHLTEALVERGHEVTVIDDLSTGHAENLAAVADRIRFVEGSITDLALLRRHFAGVDCVFHQAALASVPRSIDNPLASNEVNVTGTLNVFVAARESGVRRVVYAASSSLYGDTEVLPKVETMMPTPQSPYAVTKRVAELYGAVFTRVYGLSTVGLRYFNVFGPRQDPRSQYAAVIPLFITKLLAKEAPLIHGDGEQSRDFTFIRNVVDSNIAAGEAVDPDPSGLTMNIACGRRITINELFRRIRELLGSDLEAVYGPARTGDVKHSLADIELSIRMLRYKPAVDLPAGLAETVSWYRRHYS